ncbi:MAG: hypothetical protein Salg2KO_18640 [Salibacteraceae bacterium]
MLSVLCVESNAQNMDLTPPKESSTYSTAIGVRAGGTSGITIKHFITSSSALEGIISFGPHWMSVHGLYEFYTPAFNAPGLNWYYGGGGHFGIQSERFYWPEDKGPKGDRIGLGVDGIVGLEYKIPPIPIAISIDVKPMLGAWTDGGIRWGIDPGLGVKLAF